MTITPQDFRQIMGHWATGVAIATTLHQGRRAGITINSFTSVSLEPPLVSFCLGRQSLAFPVFAAAMGFAINLLGDEQQALVGRFAAKGQDEGRWLGLELTAAGNGSPLIAGSLATLECRRESLIEVGDHAILIGQVVGVLEGQGRPLLRYRSKFGDFLEKS